MAGFKKMKKFGTNIGALYKLVSLMKYLYIYLLQKVKNERLTLSTPDFNHPFI